MSVELIQTLAKYLIAGGVIAGCFILIYQGRGGDMTQPWSAITLIVGWLIRDSAGNSAAANAAKVAQAAGSSAALPTS